MRIAQIAPLIESVPPRLYGGTERIVSYLTEELVARGHDVTLFASGDSVTRARLVPVCPRALRLDHACVDRLAHQIVLLEQVAARAHEFDILHFHIDYFHFPLSRRLAVPSVTTLHGRLDIPDLVPVYSEFPEMPVISISYSQREPLPWLNWAGNVYHGLPPDMFRLQERPGDYLAFLGRISPEKRVDLAIQIAQRARMPLRVAAKIDKADHDYFESRVAPLLKIDGVEFIGEINDRQKADFLAGARALLFPIDWPEPFGIVMIEAMACGTPVIALRRGSVPEVLENGLTGFIVESIDEAVAALGRLDSFDRARCRRAFEQRFTAARMAGDYLEVYNKVLSSHERATVKT